MIEFTNCKCNVEKGKFSINDIPLDCPAVWRLVGGGHTVGVFQLETNLGQDWSKRVRPNSLEELAALTALLRPGPLECIGENTPIARRMQKSSSGRTYIERITIGRLYEEWEQFQKCKYKGDRKLNILSINETNGEIINNKIIKVIPKGRGKTYSVRTKTSWTFKPQARWLDIRATENHFFLTSDGWKQLKDISRGDYVAVFSGKRCGHTRKDNSGTNVRGHKNFRNIAFYHWKYKCVCCDWDEASLDVNHLVGNRFTDNTPDNLVWLCPNHHRMYTEDKIDKQTLVLLRENHRLPQMKDIRWARVEEIAEEEEENLYDIAVEGPNHNYIAGNFVVHNSGMTQDFVDIKFGRKKINYLHPSLEPILEPTYGCLVYQEQAIRIATDVAGLSPEVADELRKAIGKKLPELMAKVKDKFVKGAQEYGKIGRGIAEEIFGWIEKCQRYSFNKSHAISYGMIAYQTAWLKCHFPHEFFTSYLTYSQYKSDPKEEIYRLVQDARLFGVDILPPDIRRGNIHFKMIEEPQKGVAFGLAHVRGVGTSAIEKIVSVASTTPGAGSLETWGSFLAAVPDFHRNVGIALIKSGACDCYLMERSEMVRELEMVLGTTAHDSTGKKVEIKGLTNKEKVYFFEQLQQVGMTTQEILVQMSQPPGDKTKTMGQMVKKELVTAAVGYLDQAGSAFDGIVDGESKFVYTSPDEKEAWLGDIGSRTKKQIEELMIQNGYQDVVVKPPCSSDVRRKIVAAKAAMLEQPLTDTNVASAAAEKHFLGIALSCSPADDADDTLATHTCLEIAKAPNNEDIAVCAIVDGVKHTKTKRGSNPGQPMCFLTISDSTYSIDHAVVFPDAFDRLKAFCKDDLICLVYGRKKNGSFIIKDIRKLM